MTELVAFGIFLLTVLNVYLYWYFSRKNGNGSPLLVAGLAVAMILLAGNIAVTVQSRHDINRALLQGCIARRAVAAVQVGIQKEAKQTNRLFLFKGFPGLTHQELLELVERKEA